MLSSLVRPPTVDAEDIIGLFAARGAGSISTALLSYLGRWLPLFMYADDSIVLPS